jgi:predicted esterase
VHGDQDAVVSYQWGKNTHELLKTMMAVPPSFLTIPGMGHSSDPFEIRELKKFLESKLE